MRTSSCSLRAASAHLLSVDELGRRRRLRGRLCEKSVTPFPWSVAIHASGMVGLGVLSQTTDHMALKTTTSHDVSLRHVAEGAKFRRSVMALSQQEAG